MDYSMGEEEATQPETPMECDDNPSVLLYDDVCTNQYTNSSNNQLEAVDMNDRSVPEEDKLDEDGNHDQEDEDEEQAEEGEGEEYEAEEREEEDLEEEEELDEEENLKEEDDQEEAEDQEQGAKADVSEAEEEEIDDDEDEDDSVDDRTDAELAAVALELQDLEQSVPLLKTSYHLLDRLGEGTFSSVYKAIDLHHHLYDNTQWAPQEPTTESQPLIASSDARCHPSTSTSSCSGSVIGDKSMPNSESRRASSSHLELKSNNRPPSSADDLFDASAGEQARNKFAETLQRHALECGKLPTAYKVNDKTKKKGASNVYVALKRIYVTSSPQRIMNELELLTELRGAKYVAYLIQAIRHEDQVIAIMPYRKHQDFREYYRIAPISMIRKYLYCLFSALKDTHSKGIIHRDIKPANFLFDIRTQTGVLCDFGLAEKFDAYDWHGKCLHSLPEPKWHNFHGKLMEEPRSTFEQMEEQWRKWRAKLARFRANFTQQLNRPLEDITELTTSPGWLELFNKRPFDHEPSEDDVANLLSYEWYESWKPVNKYGGLWGAGLGRRKSSMAPDSNAFDRVGFKREDTRPSAKANRAGTRGFRAPEVLLKCPDQTGAIDIWSVGVTLLCFLTRRFPFFNSNDDTDALMEIATIFGRSKLEMVAMHHNRAIISNIPEVTTPRFNSLHTLVRTLNPTIYEEQKLKTETTREETMMTKVEKCTSTIFQAHRDMTELVESAGVDLDPYEEPWYLRSELWYLVDLLKRTLDLDCTQRITAAGALRHKFFTLFQ